MTEQLQIPVPRDHLPFLDSLRGFALLCVMSLHSIAAAYGVVQLPWKGWFHDLNVDPTFLIFLPATFGWVGVPIFFVISGFCIHLSHQRSKRKDFLTYFTRRFFRIYPPYLIALLLFSFVWPWHFIRFDSQASFYQFFSHLFLIHNYFPKTFGAINGSFWTLAIEFQLYLLYPLLMLLVRQLNWIKALLIVGSLEIGMRIFQGIYNLIYQTSDITWVEHGDPFFYSFTLGSPFYFWFCWSIGAYAADVFLSKQSHPFRSFPTWIFPALLILSVSFKPLSSLGYVFAALSTVVVMTRLLERRANQVRGLGSLLSWMGTISYSAYLLHQPVLYLIPQFLAEHQLQSTLHPLLKLLLCLLAWIPILLISWFSYRWIELPSISVGKYIVRKFHGSIRSLA